MLAKRAPGRLSMRPMTSTNDVPRAVRLLRRVAVGAATVLLSAAGCKQEPEINWEHRYQEHADRIRVKQLYDFAQLIERFHQAKGHYPLAQNAAVDVAVSYQPITTVPSSATAEQLESELSAALGEAIKLPRDPQMHDLLGFRVNHYHGDPNGYALYTHLYFASPLTEVVDEAKHEHRFTLISGKGPIAKVPAWTNDDKKFVSDGAAERAKKP